MFSIKQKAARTAKRVGLMSVGLALCVIGWGFFTLAAWLYLVSGFSPLEAASIMGTFYFGLGLLFLAIARNPSRDDVHVEPPQAASETNASPLVQALMFGIQAGMNTSKSKK